MTGGKRVYTIFLLAFSIIIFSATTAYAAEKQPLFLRDSLPETVNELKLDDSYKTNIFTGAFTYSYSIEVPPGTNGLQPQISIFYVSQKTTGAPSILGTAWDFTQTYIQRDLNNTVHNLSDDEFKLVLEGSAYDLIYVRNESRYHTKTDEFIFISNYSTENNENSQYWIVRTKSSKTYRLGFNNDSEMPSQAGNFTLRWYIDTITDTYNNSVFYSYRENPYANESSATYLSNITYNNDLKRLINFTYEYSKRPDFWSIYDNGNRFNQTRRLSNIAIFADNSLVRKYRFDYAIIGNTTVHSFLENITLLGSDETTSLPATRFEYNPVIYNWTSNTTWLSPICFTDNNSFDMGTRIDDINGDGLIDIVRSATTGDTCLSPSTRNVYINNGSGWVNSSSMSPPVCFIQDANGDSGARFADVNGDNLVDILRGKEVDTGENCLDPQAISNAYINNGTGWFEVPPYNWKPPLCFVYANGHDAGTRLADVNGDGKVDMLRSMSEGVDCSILNHKEVYINNGSGWTENSNWIPPVCFVSASGDEGTRLVDVNGDGLVDFVRFWDTIGAGCQNPSTNEVYINNGSGWVNDHTWRSPICFIDKNRKDVGARFIDVNGDGLIDIIQSRMWQGGETCTTHSVKDVYINNGTGWTKDTAWGVPICFVNQNGDDDFGTRLFDANGDGIVDIIRSRTADGSQDCTSPYIKNAYTNNAVKSYLLGRVTNSLGGSISIQYKSSMELDNKGNDNASDLIFNLWVVPSIVRSNGMNGTNNVTATYLYNYSDGLYDHNKTEFRGFAYSEETRPDNTTTKHYFHQDEARTGREYKTEIFSQTNIYQRSEFSWNFTINNSYFITQLIGENTSYFDGQDGTPKTVKTDYTYDNFGNVIQKTSYGNMNITGDERYEVFEYVYNTTAWIIDKIKNYRLMDSDNSTKIREANYTYDNLPFGSIPVKGSLTKKEEFIGNGSNATTAYNYDSHGNVISVTNPNNRITNYTYGSVDTTFTYSDSKTNPKGHVTRYAYDLGTGKILSITGQNGFVTNYTYDVFGRISKEIRPFDSADYPTKSYAYELDGKAPEEIKISQREQNFTNNTFDIWQFYDGFGNAIQAKTEAENSQQIVTDTFYDSMSRIISRSNPYKISSFDNYSEPNRTINAMSFTYDSLGRTIKITSPDGTTRTFNYTKWNMTVWDENWNKKVTISDAYGQITMTQEFNGQEIYNTTYTYDASGSLVKIKDNLGNNFTFIYDMLGRKASMSDPDMGTWNYTYDKSGNLARQKDDKNITTDFTYDELNRITRRNSSAEFYNYTYDAKLNSTLSSAQTSNYTINYTYDARLRKVNERKIMDNFTFDLNYSYDSMDRLVVEFLPDTTNLTSSYSDQNKMKSINDFMTNIAYNELNNIERRLYNNSLNTNSTYASDNLRLTRIKTGSMQDLNYAYDNVSNVVSINDTSNLRLYRMIYDSLGRLIHANRTDNTSLAYFFNYTYNSIGNLLKVDGTRNLEYTYGSKPVHAPSGIEIYDELKISYLGVAYENVSQRVFRFDIVNIGSGSFSSVNWSLNVGETNITSLFNLTLQHGETVPVFVYYNYSATGNYTINATARNNTLLAIKSKKIEVKKELQIDFLDSIYRNQTQAIFRFDINNNGLNNLTSVNWTFNNGQSNISSAYNTTLAPYKSVFVFIYYNYTSAGTFDLNATARSDGLFDSRLISVGV